MKKKLSSFPYASEWESMCCSIFHCTEHSGDNVQSFVFIFASSFLFFNCAHVHCDNNERTAANDFRMTKMASRIVFYGISNIWPDETVHSHACSDSTTRMVAFNFVGNLSKYVLHCLQWKLRFCTVVGNVINCLPAIWIRKSKFDGVNNERKNHLFRVFTVVAERADVGEPFR